MRIASLFALTSMLLLPRFAYAVRVWEEGPSEQPPAPPTAAPTPAASQQQGSSQTPGSSEVPGSTVAPGSTEPPASSNTATPATPAPSNNSGGVLGVIRNVFTGSLASPDLRPSDNLTPLAAGGHVGGSRYPAGVARRWLDIGFYSQPRLTIQTGFNPENPVNFSLPPGVTLQRTRIVVHGQAHPLLQVRLEFGISDRIETLDAYALVPIHRAFQLQIGQFRVPFSRQELVSATRFQFNDTSLWSGRANGSGVRFVPSFDLGVMAWGWIGPNDLFEYYVGVFNGEGANQLQNVDAFFLYAARVAVNPLGRPSNFQESALLLPRRPTLSIGLNAARQTRQIGLVVLDPMRRPEPNRITATTLGADVFFAASGFSLYGELYYRDLLETDTRSAPNTESLGWLVQLGYFIPVEALRDHLELTFRAQGFDPTNCLLRTAGPECGVRPVASQSPEVYRDFMHTIAMTAGVNWYQTGHGFKIQANYTRFLEYRDIAGDVPGSGVVDNDLLSLQITGSF